MWKNAHVSAYCVLRISTWQTSWDPVRIANLPNVTEVKREKKTNKIHILLLFWLPIPGHDSSTQKLTVALNSDLFHPSLPRHVSAGTGDHITGDCWKDPFLAWMKTPPQVSAGLSVITDTPSIPEDLPSPSTEMTIIPVTTAGGKGFPSHF